MLSEHKAQLTDAKRKEVITKGLEIERKISEFIPQAVSFYKLFQTYIETDEFKSKIGFSTDTQRFVHFKEIKHDWT
jgi:hypothetical protein